MSRRSANSTRIPSIALITSWRTSPSSREYKLIIHDGGSSGMLIQFCPWCGTRLPASRREEWFDRIEAMGVDPWKDDVPQEFLDDTWMKG